MWIAKDKIKELRFEKKPERYPNNKLSCKEHEQPLYYVYEKKGILYLRCQVCEDEAAVESNKMESKGR
jgi:hypothetical protein